MERIEYKGSMHRIRECTLDLLALMDDEEDMLQKGDDGCDEKWWELMERDLMLKSTFLYCDLNKLISIADEGNKHSLTHLANRLFYYMQELDNAVKTRSISITQDSYNDAVPVLQEVVASLVPP